MLDQKKLNELSVGNEFAIYLLVNKFEMKTAKNGKSYLSLELRDETSALPAKIWDKFDDIVKDLKEGIVLKISGSIEEFAGAPQIRVEKFRLANDKDNVTAQDFLPKSKRPINEMIGEFDKLISSIKNEYLKKLIPLIFDENGISKYKRTPAGKGWHHAYIHGLLEHTLEICRICNLMCDIHPELNRDLLICGALLHDFGKTEELTYDTNFDYSDKGKLLGHIMIGAMAVEKAINSIPNFPEETKNQLLHLILSHQGKLEFASPVEPKTLEAIVLYQADELSAKTNAYKSAIEADKNSGNNWTRYLPLISSSLFIPGEKEN